MSEERKEIADNAEIVDFGTCLNSLSDSTGFEIESSPYRFETVSKDRAIECFQEFYDKKTAKFKIRLTFSENGRFLIKTKEIVRVYPKSG
jgi:hypothetical protein